jgi:DNA helicase-2/ATP-dependent DNA helicase PcrA
LEKAYESGLFKISERVKYILLDDYDEDEKASALRKALQAPFSELQHYSDYVSEKTEFATHQGVKGLEFDRVMIILDDYSANMKIFNYEKLFEIVPKSSTDIKNENEGKDTTIARTARLFYVACTRAKKSLAIVLYTDEPMKARDFFIENDWFSDDEISIS